MNEQLSAFMDNELSEHEEHRLLKALAGDPELRAAWGRYHLVRAVLRNELEVVLAPHAAERLAEAIQNLPGEPDGQPRRDTPRPALKLAGLLAVAASVTAVSLFGWQALHAPSQRPSAPPALAVKGTAGNPDAMRAAADRREVKAALNLYLVEHNEFAPTSSVSSMMPYVRVVAGDNNP